MLAMAVLSGPVSTNFASSLLRSEECIDIWNPAAAFGPVSEKSPQLATKLSPAFTLSPFFI